MKTLDLGLLAFGFSVLLVAAQAQEVHGPPDAPLVAEVLGTKIHTRDPDEMQAVIIGKLVDRYAAEQGIAVEPAEIDAYLDSLHRVAEQDRRRQEARREELARKLEAKTLSDAERQSLSSELDSLNEFLNNIGEVRNGAKEDSAEDKAARRQVAAAFIRQWKINQALYRQYGGRIIYQQGGPEPLDAYRTFLQARERQGAFKILNPAFEAAFWKYFLTDSMHSFYPKGSREEAQAFETPWWLLSRPERTQ
ncbi:MAG: hypothetical protein NHG36_11320 [Chromatiaceae bacterium]|nr:hypothetical protein [Candidatus Thioaporhodococcus sediminis]